MEKRFKHIIAIFFTILFMAITSAPTIIASVDNTIDISSFYGLNEEEENEEFKLLINIDELNEGHPIKEFSDALNIGYRFKSYSKPHPNPILPPPELRF